MPGFGSGGFGGAVFGQFDWSRRVLFETAPQIYRTADLENEELFRRYAEAQGGSFDNLRLKIASFADLRDPRAVRTRYDEGTALRLGRIEQLQGPVEQRGVLATVVAGGVFTARQARFTFADVGKELTVLGSSVATNNRAVLVTNIVSALEVLTNPPLSVDTGPLQWELRPVRASEDTETRVQVLGGDVERVTPGWILSDGFSDFVVLSRRQFKPAAEEWKLLTLREGSDGAIDPFLRFTSPTLALTSEDVGRRITVSGSARPDANEGKFEIVDVLDASTCILDSLALVPEPTGDLVWALLRRPELVLQGSATLAGCVEQEGVDGVVAAATTFSAGSGEFSADDVGKLLTIHRPGNADNGTYEVLSVTSAIEVELGAAFVTSATPGFSWHLRPKTNFGDETQVQVRAPNLIQHLARDFGVVVDNREEEEWQRRWVESVSRWIGRKGHESGYEYLAALTGFQAQVWSLYRVSLEVYLVASAAGANVYAVGESGAGRHGLDGSLTLVAGVVRFSSPTAAFENWDVGRQVEVVGTAGGANDGLRTIAAVIDPRTVEFRFLDGMVGPADPSNGSIGWRVVRLYTDQPPTLPVHDEINVDLMTYLKTAAVFTADKYCWEQLPLPWSTRVGPGDAGDGRLFVTGVTPSGPSAFPTLYTVQGRGDFEVAVGTGAGWWRLTDSGAVAHYVEVVPTLSERHSGIDGSLTNAAPYFRWFTSPTGAFTAAEVGRVLVVDGAVVPYHNQAFLISAVIGPGDLQLSPSHASIVPDPGNGQLVWRVLDPGASGVDGALFAPRRFTSASAAFVATDEGKRLLVSESGSGNSRQYVIETVVDANNVDLAPYNTPAVPDANNGSLVWAMFSYEFGVVATVPPALGAASLEYLCPEQITCDYCKSNKVLVEASTPYSMEKGSERLRARLEQVTPKHVELVENFGVVVSARLSLSATVDSP